MSLAADRQHGKVTACPWVFCVLCGFRPPYYIFGSLYSRKERAKWVPFGFPFGLPFGLPFVSLSFSFRLFLLLYLLFSLLVSFCCCWFSFLFSFPFDLYWSEANPRPPAKAHAPWQVGEAWPPRSWPTRWTKPPPSSCRGPRSPKPKPPSGETLRFHLPKVFGGAFGETLPSIC